MISELERRTRDEFEEDTASHLDYVVSWVESGKTIVDLAAAISKSLGYELDRAVQPAMISRYLDAQYGKDAERRIGDARVEGARRLAEETLSIADGAAMTADGAAKARNQIGTRQWLAERWGRAEFGQAKNHVQINIGTLHLDALRRRTALQSVPSPARAFDTSGGEGSALLEAGNAIASAITIDAEVLSIEESES